MTREEAIKEIKSWDFLEGKEIEAIETLIPELRESEDERIRKKCIELIKRVIPSGNNQSSESKDILDCIAYLEKQKELFESGRGLYYYDGEKTTYFGYPATEENLYDFAISQQEKQKESLHIEKTCKENADSFTREWSEEDEKMVQFWNIYYEHKVGDWPNKDVVEHLERFKEWLNNRLKSLRPQPKQEWSEEDERIIDTIVSVLGQYIDYKAVSGTGSGYATPRYSKEIDWLKSLRPPQYCENCKLKRSVENWKPSEEQIYSLGTVVKGAGENNVGSVGYNLKELYEHLKKLGVKEKPEYYQHFDQDC